MLKFPKVWRGAGVDATDLRLAVPPQTPQAASADPADPALLADAAPLLATARTTTTGGAQRPASRVIQMPQRALTRPLPGEASRAFVRAVSGDSYRDAIDREPMQTWLATLPPILRPTALAGIYPRIVKKIARLWDDHDALLAYMDDLTIDRRGGRIGFPPKIADEIDRLHDFIRLCPRPRRSDPAV